MLVACCVIVSCAALFIGLMLRMERDTYRETPVVGVLPSALVDIGSRQIVVELAMTSAAREQGLSDREFLSGDHGMLFLFDRPEPQTFWMHRMKFPIDMVFLREGVVVDVHANVPSPTSESLTPAIVRSKTDADQVLEINAGKAAEWGIVEGTRVEVFR